jgi:hypothetical protein
MSKITEFFGHNCQENAEWKDILNAQVCPYTDKRCYKVRKSDPDISIGTCSVLYGSSPEPIIICPNRLLERGQIFTDCFHLLTQHEPGNELHVVSEVAIPGGSVDYFLVSARQGKVVDFAGVELQTLDTTGTLWPERQNLLDELGILDNTEDGSKKSFGMNWKMTAKTILMQIHHKIQTFEHINKKLALVVQGKLLEYMSHEFRFSHMNQPPRIGDSLHIHAYCMNIAPADINIQMISRCSTDSTGVSECLGLQAEACMELQQVISLLQSKISNNTRFTPMNA